MRCLGRCLGCLLVVVIMAVTPAAFWFFTVWDVMSNADSYTDSLDDQSYEDLAVLTLPIVAELVAGAEQGDDSNQAELFADVITNIDHGEWKAIVGESIEPAWVKDLINRNLNNGLRFLRYETDKLDIRVDFSPVVAAINEETLVDNMMDAVRSWEGCTQDETFQMAIYLDGRSNTFPKCNPGDEYLNTIETRLRVGIVVIQEKLEEYPSLEFELRNEVKVDPQFRDADEMFNEVRKGFFFIENTRAVMFLFSLMLFGLVIVFAVRSAKELFLWGGITLVLTGVFTLLPLVPWIYGLIGGADDAPRFLVNRTEYELSFRLQRLLFEAFAEPIILEVVAMLVIGFIFLVLAGFLKGPSKATESPVYYVMPSGSTPQPMYPVGQYVQTSTPPPTPTPIPVKKETRPLAAEGPSTPSPKPTVARAEKPSAPDMAASEEELPPQPPSIVSEHIRGAIGRLGVEDDDRDDKTFVPTSDTAKGEGEDGDRDEEEDE